MKWWHRQSLDGMTEQQWEALCDGCGRCCLHKLEDADSGEVHYTAVACRLLDIDTCRCTDYANRRKRVPDCMQPSGNIDQVLRWAPATCAYRLLAEGKRLPEWHPLVSGRADSVHAAGISVRTFALPEGAIPEDDLTDHVIELP